MSDSESKFRPNQYPVELSAAERKRLTAITSCGRSPARKIRHAQILLLSDCNHPKRKRSRSEISELLGVHINTVDRIRKRFFLEGESPAVNRKIRLTPPCPPIIDGDAEAQLVAICCSQAPEGRISWTMQLLADEMVKRKIVTQVSAETVRRVLKKRSKAVEEKKLVHSRA